MASTPVGPSTPRLGSQTPWNTANAARPRSQSPHSIAEQTAQDAAQANHDASNQITNAEQAVQQAQNESDAQLEHIRDGFQQEQSNQTEKNQEALEKQRLKGYEELRDLKQRQQAELNRMRREGERNVKQTGDYYRDTLYNTSRKDEDALRQQESAQARQMKYLSSTGQQDFSSQKQEEAHKLESLHQMQQQKLAKITKSDAKEYERMKENSELSRQQEAQTFQRQYDAVLGQDRQAIDNVQNSASQQLHEIRQDTSQKLAAYSSRQGDPFYKMLDLGAELHDRGDSYVLSARIPVQEQAHVSATVRGNTLVISGNRRNQEHLDLGDGHTRGTSSYQSYEESFPLAWPVDRNQLTKEFQGDRVVITVPKLDQAGAFEHRRSPGGSPAGSQGSKPERVRVERPDFPGNLPVAQELSSDNNPDESGHKPFAGRTLA